MLERGVGVHIRETGVEYRHTHALAADVVLLEQFPVVDSDLLRGERNPVFGDLLFGNFHIAGNQLDARHKGELPDDGDLLFRGHHAGRVEPPRRAHQLLADGLHLRGIVAVHGIVGDVIEVRTTLRVTLNGLRIKVLIRIELRVLLVREEHPIAVLRD